MHQVAEQFARRALAIEKNAQSAKCDLMLRYFDIKVAAQVDNARWQQFQVDVLNDRSSFRSMNKSRQIGASFIIAGDSLGDGFLKGHHNIVALSYNLEEAKEKIRYIMQWWESRHSEPWTIPARGEFDGHGNWRGASPSRITDWPEIVKQNALEIEWSSGFRFISHPSRPPRGKQASVILDEFAHYQFDEQIFTAAIPMTTRGYEGKNTISILSTPLGASGKFWEVHTDSGKYPLFKHFDFGWWEIEDLCIPERRIACRDAFIGGMSQEDLVRQFGTRRLKMLWNSSSPRENFYQEYGLSFLDSKYAFISWDLINSCQPQYWDDKEEILSIDEADDLVNRQYIENEYKDFYIGFKCRCEGGLIDLAIEAIRNLAEAVRSKQIPGVLVWTFDCGRDHDCSEITVWEYHKGFYRQRLLITMPQIKFEHQKTVIKRLLEDVPHITRGMMDKGGPGRQLAEEIPALYGEDRAQPVWFDNEKKDIWATTLKGKMEQGKVTLIPDKDQDNQLHSMKRVASAAKNFIYKLETTSTSLGGGKKITHHGDKFWVDAMACYLCSQFDHNTIGGDGILVLDEMTAEKTNNEVTEHFKFARSSSARSSTTDAFSRMGRN
jgi:phage FluMu gp28-like protein